VIAGWLAGEDCPDCGGPLLETSASGQFVTLDCPGCGYHARWHAAADRDPDTPDTRPGEQEAL
jgi:hypothetical protein